MSIKVIGISGNMGAGKTTLAKAFSRKLFFDDELKDNADMVLDALTPTEEQVKIITQHKNLH